MEIVIGVIFASLIFFITFGKEIIKDLKIRLLFSFGIAGILISILLEQMDAQISTQIGSVVVMIIAYFIDSRRKTKSQNNALTTNVKILTNSHRRLETIVIDVKSGFEEMRQEADFERVLRNSIISKGNQILNSNYSLNDNARNIVTFVSRQIEDLSFLFYYSPHRKDPDEMENYLRNDIEQKKAKACTFIDNIYKGFKYYKQKQYKLSGFIDDLDTLKGMDEKYLSCNTLMELLILDLKKNGLNKEDTIKIFTKFLTKYLESLIKTMLLYEGLDNEK